MTPVKMNFVQWCIANGYPTEHDVLSHIHAGLRSARQTKTYKKWYEQEILRLQALVREAKELYEEAIVIGSVADPSRLSRKEKLLETAKGHPDNPSVQAARRILEEQYGIEIY